ncbi:myo-inositol-1(or 4)-monophosphatase [Saccharothrix tamanrassetensis]|uniref:Myo-inositol-1(Or 4)-monophosphatase n=1 Tax=Saccharothrix tamanrassetensis TaxID=1051531 RepID=A0A841CH12_9PSEU|nr:inositol monophosphatase family protein [Saccharothrix tamanrassetensis]MBB5954986.1 myo-inositol-1(or 4)-monophosphatase [Saccharothrix tamanrassetensis]
MTKNPWPVPEPQLTADVHPALAATARAAARAYQEARHLHTRAELREEVADGADGTPTMRVDAIVEFAIAEAAAHVGANLLSEEAGFVDNGSAATLVIDPVDGSANAATGVPLSCFAGALVIDTQPVEALTVWFDTGRAWSAKAGQPTSFRTSGRTRLKGASICMMRPKRGTEDAWMRLADAADRIRILCTTCLETMLVAEGAVDAFADPGSDTHRLMDLIAALVTVPAAGGALLDLHGRPLTFDLDLSRRWSGIAAATPALADELITTILG